MIKTKIVMQKAFIIALLFMSTFVFSQQTEQVKIELKDNHYSKYTSVAITSDDKHFITSDESGKILQFSTSDFSFEKTIKTATGISINSLRLLKNDSILMVSQKYDYPTIGSTDSLIMISLHDSKVIFKEQRNFTFMGAVKNNVIISNTSDYDATVIDIFESNFKKITKFKTDKNVKIVELSTNKKKVIYTEGNLVFQNKIIIRDVETNNIDKEFLIDSKVTVVHLFFDENSENFYAIGYLESEKKMAVYKGENEINWNIPIYIIPFDNYYSGIVVSHVIINKEHNIMFTSKNGYNQHPILIKYNEDLFTSTTINMEKSPCLSLQISSKDEIIFFQNFNSNFSNLPSFYVYNNVQKKVVNEYPKTTAGFYAAMFLPNDNWMAIGYNNKTYSENVKFYKSGTFYNRFGKFSINNYLELNHKINNYSSKIFIDRNSGNYIFSGKIIDSEFSNKITYYEFDFVNDKVTKIVDDAGNFHHVLDFNIKDHTLLLSEDEYTSNSFVKGYKIRLIKNGETNEINGIYKSAKLSIDGTKLLTINNENLIEVRETKSNKVIFTQQLDEGNYSILTVDKTAFMVSATYNKWLTSNCKTQTFTIELENGSMKSNVKDCIVLNDASFANNKIAMIINNNTLVAGEKVIVFNANELPQMISYNQDASKLMVSFKNGNIAIYDGETLKELVHMIHPDNESHIYFDSKGNYFSNIDADEYLIATKNKQRVSLKSIKNSAFSPKEILTVFGKPNQEYLKTLDKALEIKKEYETKNLTNSEIIAAKDENKEIGKPNLYLVSIGVSNYKQSNYNLTFADKDAKDIFQLYSKFSEKESIEYKDKFFGNSFNVISSKETLAKPIKKYLGSYSSIGEFYLVNAKSSEWIEINHDKLNLWNFTTQNYNAIEVPNNFKLPSYGKKIFPFSDDSGFAIIGNDNKVLNYNFKDKITVIEQLPTDANLENSCFITSNEWLLFEQIPSWETSKISIYSYNLETNQKTIKATIDQFESKDSKGIFSTTSFNNNYFIANYKAISPNGKYLLYTIDETLYLTNISENHPISKKIATDIKIKYGQEVSVANDGKSICVLEKDENDVRYNATVYSIEGTLIDNQTLIDKENTIKGFTIHNSQPSRVEMSSSLITVGGFSDIENIDLLNQENPFSFENVYATYLTDEKAISNSIKEILSTYFKNTNSNDQILVFLAGHGVLDSNKQYYFAPHDMNFNDVSKNGLSFDFIVSCLKNSASKNKLLLMDSCHSGSTLDAIEVSKNTTNESDTTNQRGSIGSSSVKNDAGFKVSDIISTLFDDFLSNSGVTILSASSGSDVAYENKKLGNGAFTSAYISLIKSKFNNIGIVKSNDLKISIPLTKEYISDFFKNVMILTQNKQMPDIREINDFATIKIW
jgi:hypothetical protein